VLHRERIFTELERRMTEVIGVGYVARNPGKEPSVDDLPSICIFEMEDPVQEVHGRGAAPVYKREIKVVIEPFIKGSSDALSTKELMLFVKEVKKKIYEAPAGLGKLAHAVVETGASRVHRPPAGDHVAGIGISLTITYVEDTTKY
jgi:hypothetical protein